MSKQEYQRRVAEQKRQEAAFKASLREGAPVHKHPGVHLGGQMAGTGRAALAGQRSVSFREGAFARFGVQIQVPLAPPIVVTAEKYNEAQRGVCTSQQDSRYHVPGTTIEWFSMTPPEKGEWYGKRAGLVANYTFGKSGAGEPIWRAGKGIFPHKPLEKAMAPEGPDVRVRGGGVVPGYLRNPADPQFYTAKQLRGLSDYELRMEEEALIDAFEDEGALSPAESDYRRLIEYELENREDVRGELQDYAPNGVKTFYTKAQLRNMNGKQMGYYMEELRSEYDMIMNRAKISEEQGERAQRLSDEINKADGVANEKP